MIACNPYPLLVSVSYFVPLYICSRPRVVLVHKCANCRCQCGACDVIVLQSFSEYAFMLYTTRLMMLNDYVAYASSCHFSCITCAHSYASTGGTAMTASLSVAGFPVFSIYLFFVCRRRARALCRPSPMLATKRTYSRTYIHPYTHTRRAR